MRIKSNDVLNSEFSKKVHYFLLAVICMFTIITGCKKDNSMSPSPFNKFQADRTADNILTRAFNMIDINHEANLTAAPDYRVTVKSNGLVVYEGRYNVGVKGKVIFNIPKSLVEKLSELFEPPSLSLSERTEIASVLEPPALPEHEIITTTYSNGTTLPSIWIDNNTGYPHDVVYRRMKVEELLKISKYVNLPTSTVSIKATVRNN